MRKQLGSALIQGFFESAAAAGRLIPSSRKLLRKLTVARDLAYGPLRPWNLLDVWQPPAGAPNPAGTGTRPALLYLHGGAAIPRRGCRTTLTNSRADSGSGS